MNSRVAAMPLVGLRVPPRVRNIPTVRRRLNVAVINDPPQEIIIRHAGQNLDSAAGKSRQIQNQRA
jgi:hypothetical protein